LPGPEADWSHVSSAKVTSEWSCFSSPQDAFMACTGETSALCVKGSRQPNFRHYCGRQPNFRHYCGSCLL